VGAEYAANKDPRPFPLGVDADVFDATTVLAAAREAGAARVREHLTPYFEAAENGIETRNVTVSDVYGTSDAFRAGPELRMTLDEPADYRVYEAVYRELEYDRVLDSRRAASFILEEGLDAVNKSVEQRFR
jgi:spore coat polysaccharide biosynthesis protein SpsF (cytidylyltransferase family)